MARVAVSLNMLNSQLNELAPRRSKASDGGLPSKAHSLANPYSDHEPKIMVRGEGVGTARDFTHDPAGGLDCNKLAAALIASKDPRIKYLIWNYQWWRPGIGWAPYRGSNPHDKHLHLSVDGDVELFDNGAAWDLSRLDSPGAAPAPVLPLLPLRRPRMYLVRDPRTGTVYLITSDGVRPLANHEEWACFQWLLDDDRDPDLDQKAVGLGDTPNFNTRFFQVISGVLARPVTTKIA